MLSFLLSPIRLLIQSVLLVAMIALLLYGLHSFTPSVTWLSKQVPVLQTPLFLGVETGEHLIDYGKQGYEWAFPTPEEKAERLNKKISTLQSKIDKDYAKLTLLKEEKNLLLKKQQLAYGKEDGFNFLFWHNEQADSHQDLSWWEKTKTTLQQWNPFGHSSK